MVVLIAIGVPRIPAATEATSHREIAAALNVCGIHTARGGA